jgi:ClpX C4-type zinc finger
VDIAAIKGELQCHIRVNPTRAARWWKRRPSTLHGCSFCGRTAPNVGPLVNGPGVTICVACVALAGEILASRKPAA